MAPVNNVSLHNDSNSGAAVMLNRNALWGYVLAILVIALDLWTKSIASSQLMLGVPVNILPVFDFTLQHNPGAAFSFLADASGWQRWLFTAISALVGIALVVWIARLQRHETLIAFGLSMILGGALGNLWDRVTLGYVVDFISVHYADYYFPAFNIADSAITVGAGLMILDMLLSARRRDSDASGS